MPVNLLEDVVLSLEQDSARAGWDAPPRLYALVDGAELRRQAPELAGEHGVDPASETIAALEQSPLPRHSAIEDALASIVWPDSVAGCALVLERIVLPPGVEDDIPPEDAEAARWAADHPAREDVRMVVGVLRDGTRFAAMRLRRHDADDEVLSGADLVPGLADALAATLEPDEPPE